MNPHADFPKPFALQFRGSRLANGLLRLAGWRLHFEGLPGHQGVLAVYPHTSNWDTVILIVAKWAAGAPMRFWSKDSLFRVPLLGRWLSYVGGVPVNREMPGGMTAQAIELMSRCRDSGEHFWLCMTPEGTRRHTEGLRSGFYRIALGANVPLGLVRLDYGAREVVVSDFMRVSGDRQADLAHMAAVYDGVVARRPHQVAPLRLLEASARRKQTSK